MYILCVVVMMALCYYVLNGKYMTHNMYITYMYMYYTVHASFLHLSFILPSCIVVTRIMYSVYSARPLYTLP